MVIRLFTGGISDEDGNYICDDLFFLDRSLMRIADFTCFWTGKIFRRQNLRIIVRFTAVAVSIPIPARSTGT